MRRKIQFFLINYNNTNMIRNENENAKQQYQLDKFKKVITKFVKNITFQIDFGSFNQKLKRI